ncbi:MAG TPA: STAS domain-containing protein [Tepidisphaeraceae bacterium]|jgi:anti-anti-sigma factor
MPDVSTQSKHVIDARQDGDTAVFRLKDEIDLHSSPDLRTDILAVLQKGKIKKLVLNLAEVPYVDSSAIAVMVEALQKLRKTGGKVCLTNLSGRVKGLLEIARLDQIFTVKATEAEALAA